MPDDNLPPDTEPASRPARPPSGKAQMPERAAPVLIDEETLDLSTPAPTSTKSLRISWHGQPSQPLRPFPYGDVQFWLNESPVYYAEGCWAIKPQAGLEFALQLAAPELCTLTFELFMPEDAALRAFHQAFAATGLQAEAWNWETPLVLRLNNVESLPLPVNPLSQGFLRVTTPLLPASQPHHGEHSVWLGTNQTALKTWYLKSVTLSRYRAVTAPVTNAGLAPGVVAPASLPQSRGKALYKAPKLTKWEEREAVAEQWRRAQPSAEANLLALALEAELARLSKLYEQCSTAELGGTGAGLQQALATREQRLTMIMEHLLRLRGVQDVLGDSPVRLAASGDGFHFFKSSVIFKNRRLRPKNKRRLGVRVPPGLDVQSTLAEIPAMSILEETLDLSVPDPPPTKHLRLVPPDEEDPDYYYCDGCWTGSELNFVLDLEELDQCTLTFELFIPDDPAVRALYQQQPDIEWQTPVHFSFDNVHFSDSNLPLNPLGRDFVKVTSSFLQHQYLEKGANPFTLEIDDQTIKKLYVKSVTLKRFDVQRQEKSQWCWAAVCASLVSLLTPDNAMQKQVVRQTFARTKHAQEEVDEDWNIEQAARKLGLEVITTDRRLPLRELREGLELGLPIPLQLNWVMENGDWGSGHYVVLTEIEEDRGQPEGQTIVSIEDPLHGVLKLTFDELKQRYPGAANQHLYAQQGRWTYTHCIFPLLAGERAAKAPAPPKLTTWAKRVAFAERWAQYYPGKETNEHWRALQFEIDQVRRWYQHMLRTRRPSRFWKAPDKESNRRERRLKALHQHLLRLLSVQTILQSQARLPEPNTAAKRTQ
jgi:hypothetical protein